MPLGPRRRELWESISRKAAFSKECGHLVEVTGCVMVRRVMGQFMFMRSETASMSEAESSSTWAAAAAEVEALARGKDGSFVGDLEGELG